MAQTHHWRFNETAGSTAAPSTGGTSLTLLVPDTFGPGRLAGKSLAGKASASLAVPAAPLTLMSWVRLKVTSAGNIPLLGWWADATTVTTQFALWAQRTDGFGPPGQVQANARVNGSLIPAGAGVPLELGVWTHVAMSYDGATLRLFLDGVQVGSNAVAGALPTAGVFSVYGDQADHDDTRVFDTALSAAEVVTWMDTTDPAPAPDPTPDPTPEPTPDPLPGPGLDPASVLTEELWSPPTADTWRSGLTTLMLESWLRDRGLGPSVAVIDGPAIPSDPGSMVVVTWLAGAGFSLEQMLDTPGFQLRVIGPQGNRAAARELADRIDTELVHRDRWPGFMGARYVVTVTRSGGKPAHDRTDAAGRAHYVCTYLAETEAQ